MKARVILVLGLCLTVVFATGCGKKVKEIKEAAQKLKEMGEQMEEVSKELGDEEPENVEEAMEKMGKILSGGKEVETVDFRELKALLPESLPNMPRQDISGEKNETFGISISEANASYSQEEGYGNVTMRISDIGDISGLAAMAGLAWAMSDFERETDEGYEKTTTFHNHKAVEEYNYNNNFGKLEILVAERFVVSVEGYNVEMDYIRAAAEKVDLKKLEGWKDYGVKA